MVVVLVFHLHFVRPWPGQRGQVYNVNIPDLYRETFRAGQEVAVSAEAQGHLVLTPVEQIRETLLETFGLWADRADLPTDSIDYVDEIRRGTRLDDFEARADEAD